MLRILFNAFEYIFYGFFLDLQGFTRISKGFSWAFSCKSKENPKKMYSNGLKNILKIV